MLSTRNEEQPGNFADSSNSLCLLEVSPTGWDRTELNKILANGT